MTLVDTLVDAGFRRGFVAIVDCGCPTTAVLERSVREFGGN